MASLPHPHPTFGAILSSVGPKVALRTTRKVLPLRRLRVGTVELGSSAPGPQNLMDRKGSASIFFLSPPPAAFAIRLEKLDEGEREKKREKRRRIYAPLECFKSIFFSIGEEFVASPPIGEGRKKKQNKNDYDEQFSVTIRTTTKSFHFSTKERSCRYVENYSTVLVTTTTTTTYYSNRVKGSGTVELRNTYSKTSSVV